MSTDLSGPAASPAVSSEPSPSFLSILGNLLVAPREAFAAILRRPSPWLPLVLFVAMHLVFVSVWTSKMDVMEFLANQQAETGSERPLPPASAAPVVKGFIWLTGMLAPVLALLVTAVVLMFVYRVFFDGEITFKQAFTIVTWSFLILSLVTIPLLLAAMAMKGAWNEDPGTVVAANLTLVLDRASTAKPLYALAKQLDLFGFWLIWLLATGFGVALRKPTGSALWGVAIPWLILVLIGVGWAAIF
jgi:hypothetical protein